jgi:hypothetical protein
MCFEYLPARAPFGIALLRNLQPNAWILGAICLFFQISPSSCFLTWFISAGLGSPFSCNLFRQALYALLELHLPMGVSFQQSMSLSSEGIIGVFLIVVATGS